MLQGSGQKVKVIYNGMFTELDHWTLNHHLCISKYNGNKQVNIFVYNTLCNRY